MKIISLIILGLLEFVFFSWVLKLVFIALINRNITMTICLLVIIFILWIGKKLENMTKFGVGTNGK